MENTALVNNLTNILNGLDDSQEKLEKDAFDVINSSDTSLNLVRESIGSVEEILKMIDTLMQLWKNHPKRFRSLRSCLRILSSLHRSLLPLPTERISYPSMLLLKLQERGNTAEDLR